jgi:hypothetical protein
MELSKLMIDTRDAWVEYPGFDGFEVRVVNLARQELIALRKRCVSNKVDRKTKQVVEVLDEEKFIKEFTKATIKGWKGLKYKYLESFLLVDVSALNPEHELAYSEDNAELLVKNSSDFDTWVNEVVFDLENFRGGAKDSAVEAPGKVV